jgi:hypothetical protein
MRTFAFGLVNFWDQGDLGWVYEKIAQNVAQPLFVKINAEPLLWKKVVQKILLLLQFPKNCPE